MRKVGMRLGAPLIILAAAVSSAFAQGQCSARQVLGTVIGGQNTCQSNPVVTSLGVRSSGSAFNVVIQSNDATLAANRTLNLVLNNGNRGLSLSGDVVVGSSVLTFSGAFATTITSTATTNATLPAGTLTLASLTGTETFTNKTLTSPTISAPTITGGTYISATALSVRNSAAAFDLLFASTDASMSANRTLTFDTSNGSRTIALAGNFTLAGGFALTLTNTAITNVTLPTAGTLIAVGGTSTVTQDAASIAALVNASTGTSALIEHTYTNSANTLSVGIGGTGYTGTAGLQNFGFLLASSGAAGINFYNAGDKPIVFTLNAVERARFQTTALSGANGVLTVGLTGSTLGCVGFLGNTSGVALLCPQAAAGTPTIQFGTVSGTNVASATSPLTIGATTGTIACATCGVTGTGLGQFASTTSAAFFGVISDETGGTGVVVGSINPAIVGGSHISQTALSVRSTGAAFDVLFASSDATLTANRTITYIVQNGNRSVALSGDLTLGGTFITSGANSLTLTTTGATNVTLPTTGTIAASGNNLSFFAATTSAQLLGVISDETGTGVVVASDSPVFTTQITNPKMIGGTAAGSSVTIQPTSSGAASGDFIDMLVGNNGAQRAARFLNGPFFLIGGTANTSGYRQQIDLTSGGLAFSASQWSADAIPVFAAFFKSRGTSIGSMTIVANGDNIGSFAFAASDGTVFRNAATFGAIVDGAPGSNDMPGALQFGTALDGTGAAVERMRISNTGHIRFLGPAAVPTVASCGTSPSAATGNDVVGNVTEGTTATGCTINFNKTWPGTPNCLAQLSTGAAVGASAISTTAVTFVHASLSNNVLYWHCFER